MDLVKLAAEYGVKNLRFFIPMRKLQMMGIIPGIAFKMGNDPEDVVECAIDETRYKVSEGYKVTLRANNPIYGTENFYISDFNSLVTRDDTDSYRIYVLTIDGYCRLKVTS